VIDEEFTKEEYVGFYSLIRNLSTLK